MKSSRLAQIAVLLWLATIAVFAWFFIRGTTVAGADGRSAIVLQPGERDLVLSEMRGLLVATQQVLDGATQGDMQRISKAARAAGMAGAADVNPALMAKLPIEFKQLGMSVHQQMDDIANAAENGKSTADIMQMVTNTLANCVACHAAWQIKSSGQ